MVNPRTVNAGLIVPLTGADVDTWGEDDVNPNMVSTDGFLCGVQAISVTGGASTLTSPAGFTPTPGAGPTQAENRVLRFSGTLTSDATVTLPLPGAYVVENFTTGNFLLILRGASAATEVIAIPQGDTVNVYNDGSRVRFVGLARMGAMEFWVGLTAMPAWVAACTVPPYLLCAATAFTFATYPYLGARCGSAFGGNGITTAATPDMRGRVPLAYDGTGTRITTAGCGLNGQTMGGTIDTQSVTLTLAQIPTGITSSGLNAITIGPGGGNSFVTYTTGGGLVGILGGGGTSGGFANPAAMGLPPTASQNNNISVTSNNTSGLSHSNVQPSQVAGIWVVKT